MRCPFCNSNQVIVSNSRTTAHDTQIWRRRKCLQCRKLFTTHEITDLKHLLIIKKSGHVEKYSRAKLFSSIYRAAISARQIDRVGVSEKVTASVENIILGLNKKEVGTKEIAEITMKVLVKVNFGVFLRYLTYYIEIDNSVQLSREIIKFA